MTTLRNLEEPETNLQCRTPPSNINESPGGPHALEKGSGRVDGQLPLQSIPTTGEETGTAGESAGHTPYPNAAILFDSGDDEDDDIKCGRCDNPISYCHCSPTMLPPHISINEEEDNEEAQVPLAETSDKENWLVEVRIGRGMGGEADAGRGVQVYRHQMYAPGTPQRATSRPLSLTPDSFICNRRQHYIPLRIPTTNGRGIAVAKWVKMRLGANPTA
jgi:hypothetical protein